MDINHPADHAAHGQQTPPVPPGRFGRLFGLIAQQARQEFHRAAPKDTDLSAADAWRLRTRALASLSPLPPDRDLARRMRSTKIPAR